MFQRLQQYGHTLSHLRPAQLAGQLWMRLRPLWHPVAHKLQRPAPPYPGCRWTPDTAAPWLPPPPGQNDAKALLSGRFCFLHETHHLSWPPRWDPPEASKLWAYNLHYFEWLWALELADAQDAALHWIEAVQGDPGHAGNEPYPTCLRLLNWCGYFFATHGQRCESIEPLWESIYGQMSWLCLHIEHHLMGNHLLENAATLSLVGSGFEGPDAEAWRRKGAALLERELDEQILDDGLHFERSPMYHLRMLYLVKLLSQFGSPELRRLAQGYLPEMEAALGCLCHPDGQIALLNDAAFGIYHEPSQLAPLTQEPGAFALHHAGYYGARTHDGHYLVCDAGALAPDYIPGHAHADIFSFELSLHGQRVLVDSGVCDYLDSETRRYCRSTQGHNTVEIDDADQAEMWGAFRVARRGYPREISWHEDDDGGFKLSGWHDGYLRRKGAKHRRHFHWHHRGRLIVRDEIEASRVVKVISRLHLHPACRIGRRDHRSLTVEAPAFAFRIEFLGPGELRVERGWYCPEFGRPLPCEVLAFCAVGTHLRMGFEIE